jgi:hypothetical protein
MGVDEAPPAPASLSMGVEEVAATSLQESMVCVVGVEEPPLASVGVNIYASAQGRAEDSDFSSLPRTTSVSRWRNISRKTFAVGLVFVAIVLAIGLYAVLSFTGIDNPCIICPNGITVGDDFVPNVSSGNSMTCLELIKSSMENESGSPTCIALSSIYKISCCPATTLPTPPEDVNVTAPTKTPTETPMVAAMTPAPTPAPLDDTTTVATTTTMSTLGTGTGVDNTCIICPDGTGVDNFAPYADTGDFRTCADLIDEAKLYETGSDDCGWFEFEELNCCYKKPDNPCNICPDGATAGDDYVPEYAGNSVTRATCKDLIESAKRIESGSDACGLYDIDVAYCCPSPAPVDDTTVTATTIASTLNTGTGVANPCIICPNGTAVDDFVPHPDNTVLRTCAELIEAAKLSESGSENCGYFQLSELLCCYIAPEIPCNICPDGATAGDDHVPEYEGNTATCSDIIESAKQFESGSDACGWYATDVAYCCPP